MDSGPVKQPPVVQPPVVVISGAPRPRIVLLAILCALLVVLVARPAKVRAAWQGVSVFLGLESKPEPASAGVLSEHEIEALDKMAPQAQAELLLERSINHYRGSNEQIAARVDGWRGQIKVEGRLYALFMGGLNSDDLRVRAAAIEIDLAGRDVEKTSASVDRLEPIARSGEQSWRANALWDLGLLGSRGIEQERITQIMLDSLHDPDEAIRYWGVEGLAHLGTDATIAPLLDELHNDPSLRVRERAACSLAQSGMLNAKQRRSVVPKLIDFSDDPALDTETRTWVFQALRDITGQELPHDSAAWRNWFSSNDGVWHGAVRDPQ